ncbi:hypothetical protein DSCW_59150 [Desulfosarcina widdelii]|uniref:Uncharacterized protein n=1 Tax=Desulfosarcina widdelii TaxID=947919 RepID=A0A5K7ZBM1_9BACT|nr:hypothetical protein DSCW_59150 [Desulfosarcina widdelii]
MVPHGYSYFPKATRSVLPGFCHNDNSELAVSIWLMFFSGPTEIKNVLIIVCYNAISIFPGARWTNMVYIVLII